MFDSVSQTLRQLLMRQIIVLNHNHPVLKQKCTDFHKPARVEQ